MSDRYSRQPVFYRCCFKVLFLLALHSLGCDVLEDIVGPVDDPASGSDVVSNDVTNTSDDEIIRIGTFNIQVFGQSKLAKHDAMDALAEIARRFDVLAIQEIRSKNQDVMPRFLKLINAKGNAHYDFIIGPRLGRTVSKEQYAYVFNTDRVVVDERFVYSVDDPDDLLHRSPLVARFQAVGPANGLAFTFTLINIHTDPDEADLEVNVLDDVVNAVRQDGSGEDDVILLGDLNADSKHLGHLAGLPEIMWVVSGEPTNVALSASYDNILFHRRDTLEFTGVGGVYNFPKEFSLSRSSADEISDHLPVWAEFSIYEGVSPALASGRRQVAR
ncbi:MAG: endonuclease/exonuclease/phosphatase family protein [Pirellulaceae bacterium]